MLLALQETVWNARLGVLPGAPWYMQAPFTWDVNAFVFYFFETTVFSLLRDRVVT